MEVSGATVELMIEDRVIGGPRMLRVPLGFAAVELLREQLVRATSVVRAATPNAPEDA